MSDTVSTNPDIDNLPNVKNKKYNNGMFFTDCIRRIDFVLVYPINSDTKNNAIKRKTFLKTLITEGLEIEIQDDLGHIHSSTDINKDMSVTMSVNNISNHSCNLIFIKLHATWKTLCRYAEIMKIRKPMLNLGVDYDFNQKTFFQRLFSKFDCLYIFNIDENQLKTLPRGFTWPFSKSKKYLFDIPEDKSEFFSPSERSLIVNYILRRASYRHISDKLTEDDTDLDILESIIRKKTDFEMKVTPDENESNVDSSSLIRNNQEKNFINFMCDEDDFSKISMDFGIAKLISDGVFESAYILHERPLIEMVEEREFKDNQRNLLYKNWVLMRNIFRLQPLDHVRLYFGEKIAFYFAWLGYYTYWLFPVSILGLIITIYNLAYTPSNVVVNEVYIKGANITMCPLMCSDSECKTWQLNDGYNRFFIIHILDNGATVLLAIVMSIWASLFLEMWKRKQNKLAYTWNVHDMEYEDEPPRPEFVALIDKNYPKKTNPISGNEEPYIPFWRQRIPVMFFTYSTVLFSIIMALALLAGIILYKLVTFPLLMRSNYIGLNLSSIITAATGSMISLIIIISLTLVYSKVAVWLTDLEHHRTQSQYDDSVTLKLYFLEFINNYSSIFYIGFLQQYTQPMRSEKMMTSSMIKPKGCPAGGCLLDLSLQLAFIMIGKQIISHIKEYSFPRLCSQIKRYKLKKSEHKIAYQKESDVENLAGEEEAKVEIISNDQVDKIGICPDILRCYNDNLLADPGPRPLFGEYIEMLIQFGFITIFIPAFPLAPLLALMNNLLEIRGDALKFVRALRRPVAQRVKDIGIWISLLSIVAQIAVKSNAILIAFGTRFIDRFVYKTFYSDDGSLEGFLEFSLSYMNSSNFPKLSSSRNITECGYMGYQYPPWEDRFEPYDYTTSFWHILAFKLIFVYLFENIVNLFMTIISVVIPDVPDKLRISMRREAKLTNEIILKAELIRHKDQNATRMVAESFRKSAMISRTQRRKQKRTTTPLASRILMKTV